MSYRELAKSLIDQIPEGKLFYIVSYLQGAVVPDEVPNAETIAAMRELDNGGGHAFSGSTADLFAAILSEPEDE